MNEMTKEQAEWNYNMWYNHTVSPMDFCDYLACNDITIVEPEKSEEDELCITF